MDRCGGGVSHICICMSSRRNNIDVIVVVCSQCERVVLSQLITKAEFADFRSNTYTYVADKLKVSGKRGLIEIYVSEHRPVV